MSLGYCPECNAEVSSRATRCPKCGYVPALSPVSQLLSVIAFGFAAYGIINWLMM